MSAHINIWTVVSFVLLSFYIKANAQIVQKQKGVSWVGEQQIGQEELKILMKLGVSWIIQTPFGWQKNYKSDKVHLSTGKAYFWGESDSGIIKTNRYASEKGIATLLKPHLWLLEKPHGKWRANIQMSSENQWKNWFRSYEVFIMHYAVLAEQESIPIFCLGTELHYPAVHRETDWRNLINKIREVYSGKLIYAANWDEEFIEIPFWDALDYIGIQAYFPLTEVKNPSVALLRNRWIRYKKQIERVSKMYNKEVIFTEIGYRSVDFCTFKPWEWPEHKSKERFNEKAQANAYQAFFETFWSENWVAGIYWWKWHPLHENSGGKGDLGFTPQNKLAQEIIKKYYLNP